MQVGRDYPLQELLMTDWWQSVEGSGDVLSVTAATVIRDYDLHNLELAVESLSDLVADNVFLPTLFATFDCGTFEIDLVQPFVQLLARCTR